MITTYVGLFLMVVIAAYLQDIRNQLRRIADCNDLNRIATTLENSEKRSIQVRGY